MSLLPGQILSPQQPIGTLASNGKEVTLDHNWYLLFWNICQQVLGVNGGLTPDALIALSTADSDAIDADATSLRLPLSNLAVQVGQEELPGPSLQSVSNALLMAQEVPLPDPVPQAQPTVSVTLGASPATYTASAPGQVFSSGGTVSSIALVRQGLSLTTGLTAGFIPVSRGDQVIFTYSAAPTIHFLPN